MFNHATDQNVGWERDTARQLVVYRTLRDVAAGEELCKWPPPNRPPASSMGRRGNE